MPVSHLCSDGSARHCHARTARAGRVRSRAGAAGDQGYVLCDAESRYISATITAPVRAGPNRRLEVALPGGT